MEEKVLWEDKKRTTLFALPLSFTKYRLETDRIFVTKGLMTTSYDEVRLYRITDVSLQRSLLQKMFGTGTIKCSSSDKTLGDFEIKNIKNSEDVKELLSERVEQERLARRSIYAGENIVDLENL